MKPKILIVDDSKINLLMLQRSLEKEYEVTTVESGKAALRELEEQVFALVLLDIMMPQIDGFTVLTSLRQISHAVDTPVIFITALEGDEFESKGLELGAIDFAFKPIKPNILKLRIRNILHLVSLEKSLKIHQERLDFILESTNEGVWDWSIENGTVSHNNTWCKMLGLPDEQLNHGINFYTQLIHPNDLNTVKEALNASIHDRKPYALEYRIRHSSGDYLWIYDRGRVVERDHLGNAMRMAGIAHNIQVRKEYEADIYRLAFYDPLTELPNRRLLLDRLTKAIIRSKRNNEHGAIMFIDMDRFKILNDTHGHQMGDLLLIQVARRIGSCIREEDTVSRFGGDEFVVLLEGFKDGYESARNNAMHIAQKILDSLNKPYLLGSIDYSSTPSIGLTIYNQETPSLDWVISNADQAMYQAKSRGRNQISESTVTPP